MKKLKIYFCTFMLATSTYILIKNIGNKKIVKDTLQFDEMYQSNENIY